MGKGYSMRGARTNDMGKFFAREKIFHLLGLCFAASCDCRKSPEMFEVEHRGVTVFN